MDHGNYMPMSMGPDYVRKWFDMMIQHYQDAVDMSKQTLTTAKRAEIKQMAQKVIDGQSKEIHQLQVYLKTLG